MNPIKKKKFHYNLKISLLQEYNNIVKQKEDFGKLESKVQWILEGNASKHKVFSYFNNKKRHRNKILGLLDSVGN